jgi:hypothetical protein
VMMPLKIGFPYMLWHDFTKNEFMKHCFKY